MNIRLSLLALISAWAFAGEGDADRGGFPADYARELQQQGQVLHNERTGLTTVYANDVAAIAAKQGVTPFPEGAVIVMEFAKPMTNETGELLRDAGGNPLKGVIEHVDVMRREPAPDAADPSRAGHWSFASYGPDGKILVAPRDAVKCADCHRQGAADRDFVFRKRPWS